jgi:hypothetical protein
MQKIASNNSWLISLSMVTASARRLCSKLKCLFRGHLDDPAMSRRIFPPRSACATASLMDESG